MVRAEASGESSGSVLAIEVAVGLSPRQITRVQLSLPSGSTVRQALDAADVWAMAETISLQAIESGDWTVGVWGRKERLGHVLRDHDRIELVRPLNVDPKEARRVRYRAHGEKLAKGITRPKAR
jgi:putative ubiquitin-RnfH superfamily antitoxin RatB of RatAB toxin-antitoxin module